MAYSVNWVNEAQKSHGEALSSKVYVRYLDGENWWNWESGAISIAGTRDPGGNAPIIIKWPTAPTSITDDQTRLFQIYEFGYLRYKLGNDDLKTAKDVCFSMYVHSSTTEGSVHPIGILIRSYPSVGEILFGEWDRTYDGSSNATGFTWSGWDPTSTEWSGSPLAHHSEEYIGSGWTRISVGVEGGFTGTTDPYRYAFEIYPGGDGTGNTLNYYMCGPQITTSSYSPVTYYENLGEIFGPSALVELSDHNGTVSLNPLTRKRERKHGVIQGQSSQIVVSDVGHEKVSPGLVGAWCAVQVGFPLIDEWETMAQGRVQDVKFNTDMKATIEFDGAVMSLLNSEISRPMFFGEEAWISDVYVVDKHKDSTTYTGSGPTVSQTYSASVLDETFQIRFSSTEAFKIYNEANKAMHDVTVAADSLDGTQYNTGTTAEWSSTNFTGETANIFTLPTSGWGSTNVDEDVFEMSSSAPRTVKQLSPIGMVRHLIEDVAEIKAYDVMNGEYYTVTTTEDGTYNSPLDDISYWTGQTSGVTAAELGGYWKRGTKIIKMVQDALILKVASVYPTEAGLIGLYVPLKLETGNTRTLEGTPGGNVNIISAEVNNSNEEYANVANIEYLKFETDTTSSTADTKIQTSERIIQNKPRAEITIKSGWRVLDSVARTCISRSLVRFNEIRRIFDVQSTLNVADLDIKGYVSITDPFLGVSLERADVISKSLDVNAQAVSFTAWDDPLGKGEFARIYDPTQPGVGTRIDQTDHFIW